MNDWQFRSEGDGLEDRLRTALRSGAPTAADLPQVIRAGRSRGRQLRRRRRLLSAAAAAGSVVAVVAMVAALPVAGSGLLSRFDSPSPGATATVTKSPAPQPAPSGSQPASKNSSAAAGWPAEVIHGNGSGLPLPRSVSLAVARPLLAFADDAPTIRLFDLIDPSAPRKIATLRTHSTWTAALALNPAGTVLATSGDTGTVRIWDVSDPASPRLTQTLPTVTMYVPDLLFSPDGRTLATAGYDNKVRLWRMSGTHATLIDVLAGRTSDVMALAFSTDSTRLAAASYHNTILWDLTRTPAQQLGQLPVNTQGLIDVAFTPTGDLVVADGDASTWDLSSPSAPRRLSLLKGAGTSLALDPVGTRLATQNRNSDGSAQPTSTLALWDLSDPGAPARQRTFSGGFPADDRGLTWTADGRTLLATTESGGLMAIDTP
jgi:hypothetical protein